MTVHRLDPWALGATLYMPATKQDLSSIYAGYKLTDARSTVVCFEDAIHEDEIDAGLENLHHAFLSASRCDQLRFVRPRNPQVLERILAVPGIEHNVHGFVLPKVTAQNIGEYLTRLEGTPFVIMPTMETAEMFHGEHLKDLRHALTEVRERVLSLRIGGNDLLNQLGMRRPKHGTLYQTPLQPTICKMVHVFKPHGFHLSAPVFEYTDRMDNLEAEVEQDLMHGLTCKTAIHPDQIKVIESHYRVLENDLETAQKLLDKNSPAVFKMNGAMCEQTTHGRWAEQVVARAAVYGTV